MGVWGVRGVWEALGVLEGLVVVRLLAPVPHVPLLHMLFPHNEDEARTLWVRHGHNSMDILSQIDDKNLHGPLVKSIHTGDRC